MFLEGLPLRSQSSIQRRLHCLFFCNPRKDASRLLCSSKPCGEYVNLCRVLYFIQNIIELSTLKKADHHHKYSPEYFSNASTFEFFQLFIGNFCQKNVCLNRRIYTAIIVRNFQLKGVLHSLSHSHALTKDHSWRGGFNRTCSKLQQIKKVKSHAFRVPIIYFAYIYSLRDSTINEGKRKFIFFTTFGNHAKLSHGVFEVIFSTHTLDKNMASFDKWVSYHIIGVFKV